MHHEAVGSAKCHITVRAVRQVYPSRSPLRNSTASYVTLATRISAVGRSFPKCIEL
jgi:hypothetical protein